MSVPTKTKPSKPRNRTGERLRAQGFDETRYDRSTGHYRAGCSSCQAAVINGIACHETGCPNARRSRDD